MSNECAEIAELKAENKRLRAALAPFQIVAREIPGDWRDRQKMTLRCGLTEVPSDYPTILQWRATLEVSGDCT